MTYGSNGSAELSLGGESATIASSARLDVGVPYKLPWATLVRQQDGSVFFSSGSGKTGNIKALPNGDVSITMNWYSAKPVVISRARWTSLTDKIGSTNHDGMHAMITQPPAAVCAALLEGERAAETTFFSALAVAALTVGANLIADFATMGAAVFATFMNVATVASAAGAYQSWQASKDTYTSSGC